jgi:hypothetical protein
MPSRRLPVPLQRPAQAIAKVYLYSCKGYTDPLQWQHKAVAKVHQIIAKATSNIMKAMQIHGNNHTNTLQMFTKPLLMFTKSSQWQHKTLTKAITNLKSLQWPHQAIAKALGPRLIPSPVQTS